MKYFHVVTVLGCLAAAAQFFEVMGTPGISAPQQGAGCAMALAFAIIPYCFVRAIVFMSESPEESELVKLNAAIQTHTKLLAEIANHAGRDAMQKSAVD